MFHLTILIFPRAHLSFIALFLDASYSSQQTKFEVLVCKVIVTLYLYKILSCFHFGIQVLISRNLKECSDSKTSMTIIKI